MKNLINTIILDIITTVMKGFLMKKTKQFCAMAIVAIILISYITTLVLAVLGLKYQKMFYASLCITVVLPCMLYIIVWLRKILKDRV